MNRIFLVAAIALLVCRPAFATEPTKGVEITAEDLNKTFEQLKSLKAEIAALEQKLAEYRCYTTLSHSKRVKTLHLDDKHCPFCGGVKLEWYAADGWECGECYMDGDLDDMWDERTPEQRAEERLKSAAETERICSTGTSHAPASRSLTEERVDQRSLGKNQAERAAIIAEEYGPNSRGSFQCGPEE